MDRRIKGVLIATAVAGLFAANGAAASEDGGGTDAEVKCLGVNECKGNSQCGVPGGHSCHGENSCKGKGWIKMSEKDCKDKGGKVLE